ncbi:MAG: UrcA family protein [Phenylobacterium sp.]
MKTIIAIATAALVAIVAGHASAQTDALKATVSYADLDLSRASGRSVLEHRIDAAVSKVCGGAPSNIDLKASHIFGECRDQAWSGVRQQLAMIYGGSQLAQATVTVGPGKR